MALTGIEIFKLLPRTNCGECGVPTCLAFAMNLAAAKAELSACPYISEEAKASLSEAAAPAIRKVTIGDGERALTIGGETVMFRHEKRFENAPGLAMLMSDAMDGSEVKARLERFNGFSYERVGLTLRPEMIALKAESGDAEKYKALVSETRQKSDASIILMSEDPGLLGTALPLCADRRPLLYAVTADNLEAMASLAKEYSCPVAVKAPGLEKVTELTSRLNKAGINDIVIDSGSRTLRKALEEQVQIRRGALSKKFKALGYPTMVFPGEMTDEPMKEALIASLFVAKYAGIIVLSDFQGESLFPLLVERMNIFTDPQRPLSTVQGVYEIGGPDENSPVLITTNFSLTYFLVSGEIESSRMPSYLLVMDTEGLSVMTAWAAGKFVADTIAPFVKKTGIMDNVKNKKLIIPGYIASESGGLEEELTGCEILVGPREGSHIPAFLKLWEP